MRTMNDNCTYDGDRESVLIAYVYGEIDPADRDMFERHLAACGICRHEVSELRAARLDLGAWQPPDATIPWAAPDEHRTAARWLNGAPVWAQVAAAVLVAGVA